MRQAVTTSIASFFLLCESPDETVGVRPAENDGRKLLTTRARPSVTIHEWKVLEFRLFSRKSGRKAAESGQPGRRRGITGQRTPVRPLSASRRAGEERGSASSVDDVGGHVERGGHDVAGHRHDLHHSAADAHRSCNDAAARHTESDHQEHGRADEAALSKELGHASHLSSGGQGKTACPASTQHDNAGAPVELPARKPAATCRARQRS